MIVAEVIYDTCPFNGEETNVCISEIKNGINFPVVVVVREWPALIGAFSFIDTDNSRYKHMVGTDGGMLIS